MDNSDFDITLKFSGLKLGNEEIDFEHERKKHTQLKMIVSILRDLNPSKLEGVNAEGRENIRKAVRNFIAKEAIENSRVNDFVEFDSIQLAYTEKKSLHSYVANEIERKYKPSVDLIEKIKREHPEFLTDPLRDEKKFVELEKKRQDMIKRLIELKEKKVNFMNKCVEARLSDEEEKNLELLMLKYKGEQIKIKTIKEAMEKEFLTRSKYMTTALNTVERDIDELLKELNK